MKINYQFKNEGLLKIALTHPSYSKYGYQNYERMEFLGDSILGLIIAELLYKKFTHLSEGKLSLMHSRLVNTKTLADIAKEIEIGDDIIMDTGETLSGGRHNPSNLENTMEALIAAIYLDGGIDSARKFIFELWSKYLIEDGDIFKKDVKSHLQEWAQKNKHNIPIYEIVDKTGVEHSPTFMVKVSITNVNEALGEGKSRKTAEISAAENLIKKLGI
jgi:ribonuclease-3